MPDVTGPWTLGLRPWTFLGGSLVGHWWVIGHSRVPRRRARRPRQLTEHFAALVAALALGDAVEDAPLDGGLARQAAGHAELAGDRLEPLRVKQPLDAAHF